MTFYSNTLSGENTTITPRWVGIGAIKKTLEDTKVALDNIAKNSNSAFSNNTGWTKTEPDKFRTNLTNTYNQFNDKTIPNYNPAASLKKVNVLKPNYISQLGPYQQEDPVTVLNSVYREFDTKISASISMIDQAQGYSKELNKYNDQIKQSLDSVINSLAPLENAFTDINKNVINPWADIVRN